MLHNVHPICCWNMEVKVKISSQISFSQRMEFSMGLTEIGLIRSLRLNGTRGLDIYGVIAPKVNIPLHLLQLK